MTTLQENLQNELQTILNDFQSQASLQTNDLFVIGCSTSEVIGQRIGTSGTFEVATSIYNALQQFKEETGIQLAFQCCEHLNRALVVEREVALRKNLEVVHAIPAYQAGGAMATYAYKQFSDPVLVEHITADAGIDIGDTFIGMHIKHVAVPVRCSVKSLGSAHVTLAKSRPKLIGGARAVYE